MRASGKDFLYFVLAIGAGYGLYKIFSGANIIGSGLSKLWEGITFDESDLGQRINPTPLNLTQQQYVDLGYMTVDSNGNYNMTALGKEFSELAGTIYKNLTKAGYSSQDAYAIARQQANASVQSGLAGHTYEGEIL